METQLSNSFYYFFSAVPQVLGGVLALFGVFVVFKVQDLKTQLLGIANRLFSEVKFHVNNINNNDKELRSIQYSINENIEKNDIEGLLETINKLNVLLNYRDNYVRLYSIREFLIKLTIYSSVFTAVIIFISLLILTLGSLVSQDCQYIVWFAFALILFSVFYCFKCFIIILQVALNNPKTAIQFSEKFLLLDKIVTSYNWIEAKLKSIGGLYRRIVSKLKATKIKHK